MTASTNKNPGCLSWCERQESCCGWSIREENNNSVLHPRLVRQCGRRYELNLKWDLGPERNTAQQAQLCADLYQNDLTLPSYVSELLTQHNEASFGIWAEQHRHYCLWNSKNSDQVSRIQFECPKQRQDEPLRCRQSDEVTPFWFCSIFGNCTSLKTLLSPTMKVSIKRLDCFDRVT